MKKIYALVTAALACLTLAAQNSNPPENSYERQYYGNVNAVRRNVVVPNIKGFYTLKGDFHMHTSYVDGRVMPMARVQEAWADDLDVIAMTEHIKHNKWKGTSNKDKNLPYAYSVEAAKKFGIIVVHGAEITTAKPFGHMNVLFIKDGNAFTEDLYYRDKNGKGRKTELGFWEVDEKKLQHDLDEAYKQGAFILWNHPGWPDKDCRMYDIHKKMIAEGHINGVEIANNIEWYPRVLEWQRDYDLPLFANSDAHYEMNFLYSKVQRNITLVFAKEKSEEGVKEALFAGRTLAWFNNTLAGDAEYLAPFVKRCLKIKAIDASKGIVTIENHTDVELQTLWGEHMTPVVFYPHTARRVTLPKGTVVEFVNCLAGPETLKIVLW